MLHTRTRLRKTVLAEMEALFCFKGQSNIILCSGYTTPVTGYVSQFSSYVCCCCYSVIVLIARMCFICDVFGVMDYLLALLY